jgi:hypothetical protein
MSLFDTLKKAIFYNPLASRAGSASSATQAPRPAAHATTTRAPAAASSPGSGAVAQPAGQPHPAAASSPAPATAQPAAVPSAVDVEAVLEALNSRSSQKLNWRSSIVDLMKLVGLDSSLQHRQELASELGYTGDKNDSAAMNIWLHKAVMRKLAENGGKVPASLQ